MTTHDIQLHAASTAGGNTDLDLAATLYLPDSFDSGLKLAALIVGHGAGSRRTRHAAFCGQACSAGFVVLALDFRGHGDSGGCADGPAELDIYAAADFLRTHPAVDPRRVCYRGSSMGGFYGLKAAATADFAALALLCPATEAVVLHAIAEQEGIGDTEAPPGEADPGVASIPPRASSTGQSFPTAPGGPPRWDTPKLRAYFEEQDCLTTARAVRCPVLLIHARDDEVVPFTHTLLITQALPTDATLLALEEGTHTTAQHDPRMHALTLTWLRERVTSCSAHT
jgi:dipeptidyl aminopeptidase/acylaminoacyl peptidase